VEQLRSIGHAAGGTVNDAALAAVAVGLDRLLAGRGEVPEVLFASVPLALRRRASTRDLGNQTVGMRVPLPLGGGLVARIERIARFTREHRSYRFDPAAVALFGVVWWGFVNPIGAWLASRQRLVNLFVTNVPGPPQPLSLLGSEVVEVVPVPPTMGNVPIAVGVFSYAGRLTLSVNADPDAVPDLDVFVEGLEEALGSCAASAEYPPTTSLHEQPIALTVRG
jgi:hypothetical protein